MRYSITNTKNFEFMSIKHREFSYLRADKEPLNCPIASTSVENIRQISLFLTNKPNSPNVQLSLTYSTTKNYANFASLTKVKFKPNQTQFKPKQSQFKPNCFKGQK